MRRPSILLVAIAVSLTMVPAPVLAAPSVAVPSVAFVANSQISATGIKVRISWPAASKASRYQLQRRLDGAAWTSVVLATAKSLKATLRVKAFGLHRFRLRAFDSAGRAGAWSTTPSQWASVAQEDDAAITYVDNWGTQLKSSAYGGAMATSASNGAEAAFTFRGTHLAWIAQRSPTRGRATVLIDGQKVATVDLYSSVTTSRQIVHTANWPKAATRTVQIRPEGTSGRPNVDVDAFVTLASPTKAVLAGAGDIGYCGATDAVATGALMSSIDGIAITLGDNAYPDGTAQQFADCYDPAWGGFRDRTRPSPGNHEYRTAGAAPYFKYFGSSAGKPGQGWYTFQAGTWRVYSLNSECSNVGGCKKGSAQYEWLKRDLASWPQRCVLAYWHRPRFSSINHGSSTAMADITRLLYDHRAEVVLASHDHGYERFALQDPSGQLDKRRGIRHFVVGTGGAQLYAYNREPLPRTVVRNNTTHGVIKLNLTSGAYAWQFLPTLNGGFADSGSGTCR
jgi:hypothetical protein